MVEGARGGCWEGRGGDKEEEGRGQGEERELDEVRKGMGKRRGKG